MQMLSAIWKSVRPINLLMIGYTIVAMAVGVVMPALAQVQEIAAAQGGGIALTFGQSRIFLLAVSVMLLAAAGNVVNDLFDIKVDRANGRSRNPIGSTLSESSAWRLYGLLTLVGLALGLYATYLAGPFILIVFHVFIAGSLWFYSRQWQQQFLMGNVVVGLLTALLPFMALAYVLAGLEATSEGGLYLSSVIFSSENGRWVDPLPLISAYALFAFWTTLMREIIKDLQDASGDRQQGYSTLAIAWGEARSLRLLQLAALVLIAFSIGFALFAAETFSMTAGLLIGFGTVPIEIAVLVVLSAHRDKRLSEASGLMKLLMLIGISTAWVFCS